MADGSGARALNRGPKQAIHIEAEDYLPQNIRDQIQEAQQRLDAIQVPIDTYAADIAKFTEMGGDHLSVADNLKVYQKEFLEEQKSLLAKIETLRSSVSKKIEPPKATMLGAADTVVKRAGRKGIRIVKPEVVKAPEAEPDEAELALKKEYERIEKEVEAAQAARREIDKRKTGENISAAAAFAQKIEEVSKEFKTKREQETFVTKFILATIRRGEKKRRDTVENLSGLLALVEEARGEVREKRGGHDTPAPVPLYPPANTATKIEKSGVGVGVRVTAETTDGLTLGAAGFFAAQIVLGATFAPWSIPNLIAFGGGIVGIPVLAWLRSVAFTNPALRKSFGKKEKTIASPLYRALLVSVAVGTAYPSLTSTAGAFLGSEDTKKFASDLNLAIKDIERQLAELERGDGHTTVDKYFKTVEDTFVRLVTGERDGRQETGIGGSGNPGYGISTARKDWLIFEGFQHMRPELDKLSPESAKAAQAWATAQRHALGIEDGNTLVEQLEAYHANYEKEAQDELELLSGKLGQFAETREIAKRIVDNSSTLMTKLNLLHSYILSPGGLETAKVEALKTIFAIQGIYRIEFKNKSDVLLKGIAAALNSNAAQGEGSVVLQSPDADINTADFEKVRAPEQRNLFSPKVIMDLFMEGHLSSQMVFILIFALMAGSPILGVAAAGSRGKRQKEMLNAGESELTEEGAQYADGSEYQLAEGIAERYKLFFGGTEGMFLTPELKETLPLKGALKWMDLSPEFVLFSLRRAAEKNGVKSETEIENLGDGIKKLFEGYGELVREMLMRGPQMKEVLAYNSVAALAKDSEAIVLGLDQELMPGFSKIQEISRQIQKSTEKARDKGETASLAREQQKLGREYRGAFMDMVFKHLIARLEFSKTRLEFYDEMYDSLKEKGVLENLELGSVGDLPDIVVDLLSENAETELKNTATMQSLGGTVARNTAVEILEKRFEKEQKYLEKVERFIGELEKETVQRITDGGKRNDANAVFFTKVSTIQRLLHENAAALKAHSDGEIRKYTARGEAERILTAQLGEEIRMRMAGGQEELRVASIQDLTDETRIDKKLQAVRDSLLAYSEGAPGSARSFFGGEGAKFNKYLCTPTIETRRKGHNGSIVDKYALVFRLTEKDSKNPTPIYTDEFQIGEEFAARNTPAQTVKRIEAWINERRNIFAMEVRFSSARKRIKQMLEEVPVPSQINLMADDASSALNTYFNTTLPRKRKRNAFVAISKDFDAIEQKYRGFVQEGKAKGGDMQAASAKIAGLFMAMHNTEAKMTEIWHRTFTPSKQELDIQRVLAGMQNDYVGFRDTKIAASYRPASGTILLEDRATTSRLWHVGSPSKRKAEVSVPKFIQAIEAGGGSKNLRKALSGLLRTV